MCTIEPVHMSVIIFTFAHKAIQQFSDKVTLTFRFSLDNRWMCPILIPRYDYVLLHVYWQVLEVTASLS